MSSANPQTLTLRPIRPRGLRDDVHDALLDMLTSGSFEPNSPLTIDGLARCLAVSQTPVREALARLEDTGLVRRMANRGYRVAPPMSAAQMSELIEARLIMETNALDRAMSRNLTQLISDLEAAFADNIEAAKRLDGEGAMGDRETIRDYYRHDWDFHQTILNHCGNRYINRAVNSLGFSVHLMKQTGGTGWIDAPTAIREHRKICDAVRSGNRAAAVKAMTHHLKMVSRRMIPQDTTNPL
ncbi:GntR family transcriptional regulator [Propionibacterium australiense]|uniref:Transcription regulator HTH, GntR n=1 Tax=Propionibacterium australiense TaxID=119981 RepID=A0A383S667_9ACTN|nr:GntR family transcriptional regulator [Propionibacterium australiense]RLP08964.1 FCD domain-containing protein [Propionibacterium australiense]SYZ33478.1 Transcription regulator HTH, GntR [Propionibacterium australiense]VEH91765.1 L-lactate utilization operon repressor [Propionibacterium australiense]